MSDEDVCLAKAIEAVRRERQKLFDPGLFDEQVWDLLLLLFIAAEEGRVVRRQDLISVVVGSDAVLGRWLKLLEGEGYVEVKDNSADALALSPEGARKMRATLAAARRVDGATGS